MMRCSLPRPSSRCRGYRTYDQRQQENLARVVAWKSSQTQATSPQPAPSPAPEPAPTPTPAPAAATAPQPAPTARKASTLPWGYEYNRKYAQAAQNGPARDREAEREKKKDERKACNKQQKQQKQR